jgi:hypothetical protein
MMMLMNTSGNPFSLNPGVRKTVASNCVAGVERNVFVFIFGPTLSPRPFGYWGQTPISQRRKAPYPAGQPKAGRIWALTHYCPVKIRTKSIG